MKRQHTAVGALLLSVIGFGLLSGCGPKEKQMSKEEIDKRQAESLRNESGSGGQPNGAATASEVGGNPADKK